MENKKKTAEETANNNWANEAICMHWAEDNLETPVLRSIYLAIVRRSFGYGYLNAELTQVEIGKAAGCTDRTVRAQIPILIEKKAIEVKESNKMRKGGGSYACIYTVVFPSGYGHIKAKPRNYYVEKQLNNSGSKVTKEIVEPENEWDKNKNVDF